MKFSVGYKSTFKWSIFCIKPEMSFLIWVLFLNDGDEEMIKLVTYFFRWFAILKDICKTGFRPNQSTENELVYNL